MLVALLVTAVALATGARPAVAQDDTSPPTPPPATVSDFYPEDANLSDCIGLVERPGCGSEARGGWRQSAILALVIVGFAVIAWRISVSIRASRSSAADPTGDPHDPSSSPPSAPPPTGRNPA